MRAINRCSEELSSVLSVFLSYIFDNFRAENVVEEGAPPLQKVPILHSTEV